MARPSILDAVERKRRIDVPAVGREEATAPAAVAPRQSTRSGIHEGKVNVSAYFPPEVKASLRLVQAKRGGKVQDLLGEALNLLFAKYNVPETAPVEIKAE
jgi:hypothetical protein